jgi:hypothetical protein
VTAQPAWRPPPDGTLWRRLRASEALRQKSGSAPPPPVLANMVPIPAIRHRFCQHIEADPRVDPTTCGAPTLPGMSWCARCAARVFRSDADGEAGAPVMD